MNYTNTPKSEFSVNGYGGGGIFENGGGGQFVCCVTLPRKWRRGLSVIVRWTAEGAHARKEVVVALPEYRPADIGFLAVHFYPNDVVKVLVTTLTARHPKYPYPRPEASGPERSSLIVTSNLPFGQWDTGFAQDTTLTTALISSDCKLTQVAIKN